MEKILRKWVRKVKKLKLDTQQIRRNLITQLHELSAEAHGNALDQTLDVKERREWARLETYISRTVNSIADSYDVSDIQEKLEELRHLVKVVIPKRDRKVRT